MVGGSLGSSELPDLLTADIPWFLVAMGASSWEKMSLISPSIGHTVKGLAHHGGGELKGCEHQRVDHYEPSQRGVHQAGYTLFSQKESGFEKNFPG